MLLASSCLAGAPDECQIGESRCDGNSVSTCQGPPCAEPGCPGNQWHTFDCGDARCVVTTSDGPACLLSPVVEPLCHGVGYCAGSEIVSCDGQFAYGPHHDCAAGCGGSECVEGSDGTPACSGENGCSEDAKFAFECRAPHVCGALVTWDRTPGTPPVALGGTIVDCQYALTQVHRFTPYDGQLLPFRETLAVSNGTLASADDDGTYPGNGLGMSGSYAVSGTSLTWNVTCPAGTNLSVVRTFSYTATATQLALYEPAADQLLVFERVR